MIAIDLQSIDFRLRKMEESAEQILSTLAVIHRFMSAHTSLQDNLQGSIGNINVSIHEPTLPSTPAPISALRLRTVSETEHNPNTLGIVSIHH